LAAEAIRQGWSVRQTEAAVAREGREVPSNTTPTAASRDPNVTAAAERLQSALGTRVRIVQGSGGRGRIELHFAGEDELRRVYDIVYGAARKAR
jgi:ParB family chromosome partitioning protein